MSQIINTYPIFEGSQVLTSEQLNQLSAYLDQQNRLTRSKLIGIGIVCGMQIQPFTNGLKISKGLGITSEGFLIQIGQDFNGTHYRPYSLPEGISYKPFGFPEQDISLFEILSSKPEEETDVKKLNDPGTFLTEKYVLLFLEIFDKDLKSCLGNACDDKGQDRIITLRRLLISKPDLDKVLTRSANVSGSFSEAPDLKQFHFKKPLFSPSGPESNQYGPFINLYQKTIQETANSEFWEQLQKGYSVFEPLLAKSFDFKNPFTQAALTAKISQIKQSLTDAPVSIRGAQYLYDFFNELALCWDEFVETGLSLWYSCPTDPSIFPLHLMLGKAKPSTESSEEFYKYRHGFVQAPIYNEQRMLKEKLAQQYRRLVLMIETFELGLLKNPKPDQYPIKITPSKEKSGPLGHRSIPYYYDIKSKGNLGNWFSLEKNWANPVPQQLWSSTRGKVLGYDNQPDTTPANPEFLESPLSYNWEAFPFLRIEGHLGYDILKAREDIQKLIKKFNLPIHLESLHLDSGGSFPDKSCGWHDLQEEYMHHRFQLLGMIRDLREILDFLQKMNEKYGVEEELFSDKDENQVLKAFELFEIWVDAMSECLEDLDWDKFQEAYKKILQTLLDFLLIQMKLLDNMNVDDKEPDKNLELINGLMARVSPLIYRILDLFYFTKIQRLFLSYLHRKSKLHNSRKFSEFLEENPGLNHEAGVYRGGTFILVYMNSSGKVIGDFSLPGAACDCQCMEACDSDDWSLLPPFARPDYAITLRNKAISIEVMVNDRLPIERKYSVKPILENSEKGGKVSQDGSSPVFIYEPPTDFAGDDAFTYLLMDEDSGLSDVGRVTIWVKSPKPQSCYNQDILACWGENNVLAAIDFRRLDRGNTLEFAIQSLLSSLQQTGGFTQEEINSEFLEGEEPRKQLLSCLGLFQDGMDYDTMKKAILDYQAENCGAPQPSPPPKCTSTAVVGRVLAHTGNPISGAKIAVIGTTNSVLSNEKGEFQIQFPNPGPTILIEAARFVPTEREICNQSSIIITLIPEKLENQPEASGVVIGVNTVSTDELVKIAMSRGLVSVTADTIDNNMMLSLMEDDNHEVTLKTEELILLKNDTLKTIADSKDIRYGSNSSKASLINLITGK
jgi:hypothetical protein